MSYHCHQWEIIYIKISYISAITCQMRLLFCMRQALWYSPLIADFTLIWMHCSLPSYHCQVSPSTGYYVDAPVWVHVEGLLVLGYENWKKRGCFKITCTSFGCMRSLHIACIKPDLHNSNCKSSMPELLSAVKSEACCLFWGYLTV